MYHNIYNPKIYIMRHNIFVCFIWFSEQSENISQYSNRRFVIITELERMWLIIEVSVIWTLKRPFHGFSGYSTKLDRGELRSKKNIPSWIRGGQIMALSYVCVSLLRLKLVSIIPYTLNTHLNLVPLVPEEQMSNAWKPPNNKTVSDINSNVTTNQ